MRARTPRTVRGRCPRASEPRGASASPESTGVKAAHIRRRPETTSLLPWAHDADDDHVPQARRAPDVQAGLCDRPLARRATRGGLARDPRAGLGADLQAEGEGESADARG